MTAPNLAFAGTAVVVQWIYSGGTVTLSGDTRSCTITPSVSNYDSTSSGDSRMRRLPGRGDATVAWEGVANQGGTALLAALAAGTTGTVIVGPQGTATGSPRTTVSGICMGATQNIPYADVVTLSVSWEGDGTTFTQGAY